VPTYVAGIDASTPIGGRWGEPSEIAAAVAFLLSDDARWVTGISLRADGGQSLVLVPDVLNALAADQADVDTKVLRK
jgi:NAD(P)-dependent dehydrogenase (short-subunit alcohol dehydrogenase family)